MLACAPSKGKTTPPCHQLHNMASVQVIFYCILVGRVRLTERAGCGLLSSALHANLLLSNVRLGLTVVFARGVRCYRASPAAALIFLDLGLVTWGLQLSRLPVTV